MPKNFQLFSADPSDYVDQLYSLRQQYRNLYAYNNAKFMMKKVQSKQDCKSKTRLSWCMMIEVHQEAYDAYNHMLEYLEI